MGRSVTASVEIEVCVPDQLRLTAPGELTLAELADVANREHRLAREKFVSAVEHAVRCGTALIEVKAQLRHSEWLPWLKANFDTSPRQAQRFMLIAANATRVSHSPAMSLRQALEAVASRPLAVNDVLPREGDEWAEVGRRLRDQFGSDVSAQFAEHALRMVLQWEKKRQRGEGSDSGAHSGNLDAHLETHHCPECGQLHRLNRAGAASAIDAVADDDGASA